MFATKYLLPLTDSETQYAQIEEKLLAILFEAKRFHHYIYGMKSTQIKSFAAMQNEDINNVSPRMQLT